MKIKKLLISTLCAAVIMFDTLASVTSTMAAEGQLIGIDDIEVASDQLLAGETAVLSEQGDIPFEEMDYNLDIVSEEDWKNTDIGVYPIDVRSAEWSQLSYSEAAAACNMPMEYAKSLTTEELVDYAINYPFIMDIFAFDSIENGMNNLENKSAVFKELFSRSDRFEELLAEYLNMEIDYMELTETDDICETKYDSELFIEAYFGLNYGLLSEAQAEKFVEAYGNKYSNMNSECQESTLSTLFLEAIDEKQEMIPASAVPESVAEKLVDFDDASDTSSMLTYLTSCSVCGASLSSTSITVNGKTVYCYKWLSGGLTSGEVAQYDKYIANYHSSFSKVRSASSKYNCHSYAWYSTSTSNVYWIDDPSPIYSNIFYWTEWKIPMRNLKSGDRITFWSNSSLLHSAIVNSPTQCTSKLGHYGVYKTTISEMKSFYGASSTQAYLP